MKKTAARKTAAKKTAAKKTKAARKTPARKTPARKTPAKKTAIKRTTARKAAARKTAVKGATRKTAAKKTAARKTAIKKTVAKGAARKTAGRKTAGRKTPARKTPARKGGKKVASKKPAHRKPAHRKPAHRKPATPRKNRPGRTPVTPPQPLVPDRDIVGPLPFSDEDTSAMPVEVSSPELLDFTLTENRWEDLSDDDKRDAVVTLLEQTVNFGVADKPAGRHAAYGDIIAPGEAASMRQALLQKITSNSSCGLLIRSAWRFLGAKDALLDPPYKPGSVITNLLKYAAKADGAMKKLTAADFDPQKGDVLYIVSPGHQHILTVTEVDDDGTTIRSIDGGQISKEVDDGGCNGIQARERKLNKKTLTFDDGKKIVNWIDITKLPFSEPMVELTKNMSDDDVA